MEKLKGLVKNPLVALIFGLVVGALFGMVVLGWWLFPVQWEDAAPEDLRLDAKEDYLRSCIDAFGYNGDVARAQECYTSLGEDAAQVLATIVQNPGTQDPKLIAAYGTLALTGEVTLTPYPGPVAGEATPEEGAQLQPTAETPPAAATEEEGGISPWLTIICLLGLIAVVVLLFIFFRRSRRSGDQAVSTEAGDAGKQKPTAEAEVSKTAGDTPIARTMASYQIGDDMFDEIFPIEYESDFLGEFGVAIAEYIGVGGPKKVSAFEVWLFDKKNIPTTTKVLMSRQAFNDPTRRQKLEAKGETMLLEPGKEIELETKTLRMVARVTDLEYGRGAMPPDSHFERLVLELSVWHK